MYDFHDNFIKKNFYAELLFTDTDSITYKIKSEDPYEEFFQHKHLYDSKFFDETNKEVIGKMRKLIGEFFKLKSKMHSMKTADGKKSNTAKRVNIATEFNEFKDTFV